MKRMLRELAGGRCAARESEVTFDLECGVLVAGLGTAGAIAALAAAENGATVIGVEKSVLCGGTATAGGVFSYYYGLPGGRFEAVDAEAKAARERDFVPGGGFHPDAKAMALERQLEAAGVGLLYQSAVIGVYLREGGRAVEGVRIVTPEGVRNCRCSVLIDAGGDGEICAAAGAEYRHGRESDGQPQPFSSIRIFLNDDGSVGLSNFDAGYAAATDNADLTRAVIDGNSRHLDEKRPLLAITLIPGPREGRLIECDIRLEAADFMDGNVTAEPVALAYSNFDSHTQDWAFEDTLARDWMVAASLWGKNLLFPIPLGAMLVKGFDNLLAAGRCLSADHLAASALRMQRCMQKLGEAAGVAAALTAVTGTPLRKLAHRDIAARLKDYPLPAGTAAPDCSWPEGRERLRELLAGDRPGEAIWTMAHHLDRYGEELRECLNSADPHLARNAALALGIAGRREALPVLRRIVSEHDDFMPRTSRSHNRGRRLGAIHLLGKLGDAESVPLLGEVLDPERSDFQDFSHALTALLEIGDAVPGLRREIAGRIAAATRKPAFDAYRLLLKNSSHTGAEVFEPMANLMRLLARRRISGWGIDCGLNPVPDNAILSWREKKLSGTGGTE